MSNKQLLTVKLNDQTVIMELRIITPGISFYQEPKRKAKPKPRINPNPEQYTKTEHWNIAKQVFDSKTLLSYDSLMLALSRRYKIGLTKVKIKGGFFELLKSYGYIVREKKGFYRLAYTAAQQAENK